MNHQLTGVRLLDGYRIEASPAISRSSRRTCAGWMPDAQRENIGETPTHVVYIELKEAAESTRGTGSLGLVDR